MYIDYVHNATIPISTFFKYMDMILQNVLFPYKLNNVVTLSKDTFVVRDRLGEH